MDLVVENGSPDSVVTSLGWQPLLSQSRFQESIFLDLSKRLEQSSIILASTVWISMNGAECFSRGCL
jgi:hypothetical protein